MFEEFWPRFLICFGLGFVIGFFLGDIVTTFFLKRRNVIWIPSGSEILKRKKGER